MSDWRGGVSLDRYPLFYVDDAFFNEPAIRAAHGEPFIYRVSKNAPYADEVWAYHGPLYPRLQTEMFRIFGVNQAIARIPDFVAGWLAALLLTCFLVRSGYRFAPLVFAILWTGDRATQELMYGRMDGLVLLSLAALFVFTERAWLSRRPVYAVAAGLSAGLACGFHPSAFAFGIVATLLITYRMRLRGLLAVALGAGSVVPLILLCWHFDVRHALAQFVWHAHRRSDPVQISFPILISMLRWSRYWFIALLIFTGLFLFHKAWTLAVGVRKGGTLGRRETHLFIASLFSLAALECLFHSDVHPYHLIFFTVWPLLAIGILVDTYGKRAAPFLALAFLLWAPSFAWNALRFRETVIFHRQLDHTYLIQMLKGHVPPEDTIVTTPELYIVPIEAGYKQNVTPWDRENSEVCRSCYLLMERKEFEHLTEVAPGELTSRSVLYAGPAFPNAGPLQYPIVLLSPTTSIARKSQSGL